MKKITVLMVGCFTTFLFSQNTEKQNITQMLDNWHLAAAEANFANYFAFMDKNSIFIGTDATENWDKKQFMEYAKPFFDKGHAWNMAPIERNIYLDSSKQIAWFDELLSTSSKICRGSGVIIKVGKTWKIKHYVLSMTIPNQVANQVVQIKTKDEELLMQQIKLKSVNK